MTPTLGALHFGKKKPVKNGANFENLPHYYHTNYNIFEKN